jgi:hypothetical protein
VFSGGFIAAATSYMTTLQAARQARALAADQRRDADRHLAYRLMAKLLKMSSGIAFIYYHVSDAVEHAKQANEDQLWTMCQPILDPSGSITFDQEEIALLFSLGDHIYLEKILMLDERYSSLVAVSRKYSATREIMTSEFSAEMDSGRLPSGPSIGSELTALEVKKYAPRMVELNLLVELMLTESKEHLDAVSKVSSEFGSKMKVYFKDNKFPELKPVVGRPVDVFRDSVR